MRGAAGTPSGKDEIVASQKVSLKSNSVAYFDHPDLVDEPGFYLVEGENEETSQVNVYDGGSFQTTDGEGGKTLQLDERGRPVLATAPELKKTITVKHDTNGKPGKRVWASPDGDGFVTEQPPEDDAPGDVWVTKNGGEN
jgi:hypothetical protein